MDFFCDKTMLYLKFLHCPEQGFSLFNKLEDSLVFFIIVFHYFHLMLMNGQQLFSMVI